MDDFREASRVLAKGSNYLKLIGGHYGCQIAGRGNVVRLAGEEEAVEKACAVIEELRRMSKQRIYLSEQHVRQCMRFLDEGKEHVIRELEADTINVTKNGKPIHPRTVGQKRYVDAIRNHSITFGIGPAGTGKTYLAVALGAFYLRNHDVERIILVRPAVEAGEKLGFLPGDMQEKVNPYLRPLFDGLLAMFGPEDFLHLQQKGVIEVAPLAYMRGRTLDNAFVILDEAQNTTLAQIKMFLTRMGRNARFIVTGDVTQIDLPRRSDSGLTRAMEILRGVEGIGIVEFDKRDIVRHQLVKYIVDAFDKYDGDTRKEPEQSNSKTE